MSKIEANKFLMVLPETKSVSEMEMEEAQQEYEATKQAHDALVKRVDTLYRENEKKIQAIRIEELRKSQQDDDSRSRAFKDWMNGEGRKCLDTSLEESEDQKVVQTKEERKEGRRLLNKISHYLHDGDDPRADLLQKATTAKRAGNLDRMRVILGMLEAGNPTNNKDQGEDDLLEKLDRLKIATVLLQQKINELTLFGGFTIIDYLDRDKVLNWECLERDFKEFLSSYEFDVLPESQNQNNTANKGSDCVDLLVKETGSLTVLTEEAKLEFLKNRFLTISKKLKSLSPYCLEWENNVPTYMEIQPKSDLIEPLRIMGGPVTRELENKEEKELFALEIKIGGEYLEICYDLDTHEMVVLPEYIEKFESISDLMMRIESQMSYVDNLEVYFDSNLYSIIGNEDESLGWKKELILQKGSPELYISRIIRVLTLLKSPHRKTIKYGEPEHYVYHEESREVESAHFGEGGKDGDRCCITGGELFTHIPEEVVHEHKNFFGQVNKVYFKGSIEEDGITKAFSASMETESLNGIISLDKALPANYSLVLTLIIGSKTITIEHKPLKRRSSKRVVSVSGIDESLLPEVLKTMVTGLTLESITGTNDFSPEKMTYL